LEMGCHMPHPFVNHRKPFRFHAREPAHDNVVYASCVRSHEWHAASTWQTQPAHLPHIYVFTVTWHHATMLRACTKKICHSKWEILKCLPSCCLAPKAYQQLGQAHSSSHCPTLCTHPRDAAGTQAHAIHGSCLLCCERCRPAACAPAPRSWPQLQQPLACTR